MERRIFIVLILFFFTVSGYGYSHVENINSGEVENTSSLHAVPGRMSRIQKYINNVLGRDSVFINSVTGICVMGNDGRIVAEWNMDMPLLPASTMKTITTYVALDLLGKDFRYATNLALDAHGILIDDGGSVNGGSASKGNIYRGNLYIIGGGDPTLASGEYFGMPADSVFGEWMKPLSDAGITCIDGDIIADDSYFMKEPIPDSWAWCNIGEGFGSAPSGLSFNENIQKIFIGTRSGKAVVDSVSPAIPEMSYELDMETGPAPLKTSLAYYTSDLERKGRIKGSLRYGEGVYEKEVSNKFPHLSCAVEFLHYLERHGIECTGKASEGIAPTSSRVIATHLSPELEDIIMVTNGYSNNLYAESLLKTLGRRITGTGSYDSSIVQIYKYMSDNGLPRSGFTMSDGSGLSRQNYVSARYLCEFYNFISKKTNFTCFLGTLPVPGDEGTMKNVLGNEPLGTRNRIHVKSGSLSNVKCYAGFVESDGGYLKFAVFVNNFSGPSSAVQLRLEEFMRILTEL